MGEKDSLIGRLKCNVPHLIRQTIHKKKKTIHRRAGHAACCDRGQALLGLGSRFQPYVRGLLFCVGMGERMCSIAFLRHPPATARLQQVGMDEVEQAEAKET